jgi:hypothetical protein
MLILHNRLISDQNKVNSKMSISFHRDYHIKSVKIYCLRVPLYETGGKFAYDFYTPHRPEGEKVFSAGRVILATASAFPAWIRIPLLQIGFVD